MQQLGLRAAPFLVGFSPAAVRRIRDRGEGRKLEGREFRSQLADAFACVCLSPRVSSPRVCLPLLLRPSCLCSISLLSLLQQQRPSVPAAAAAWCLCFHSSNSSSNSNSNRGKLCVCVCLHLLLQLFYYRAYYVPGRPQVTPPPQSPVGDWAWVSAEEAKARMPAAAFAAVKDALLLA
ncbi:hypothetical protein Efla_007641 [Eimeria flavescens]